MTDLRFTHSALDFWVDVTVHVRDWRYLATADLAEKLTGCGGGGHAVGAVNEALRSLGEPYASVMATGAEHNHGAVDEQARPAM